jgi:hypothetical protein
MLLYGTQETIPQVTKLGYEESFIGVQSSVLSEKTASNLLQDG